MSYAAYQNAQAAMHPSSSAGPSGYAAGSAMPDEAAMGSVPDVPGHIVMEERAEMLRRHVAKLCNLHHNRFPGAQPVSFTKGSLDLLKSQDFWVCEKSDGQRVLVLIAWNKAQGCQEVFLINRKNVYREQTRSLFFPSHERANPSDEKAVDGGKWKARSETLLDGELVWDTLSDGRRKMRLLLFDCLVIDGTNMASRMLLKRYGRLKELLYKPYADYMMRHPAQAREIGVLVKPMELSYGIQKVIKEVIPRLMHGNDGLIFTCINSGYVNGTDNQIIKWKPPHENTIDFKLRLRFPPDLAKDPRGNLVDFTAKPFFQLDQYFGRESRSEDGYEYFDWMHVDDEEWEQMKASAIQFDDAIVEVKWDPHGGPLPREAELAWRAEKSNRPSRANGMDESEEEPDAVRDQRPPAWRLHRVRDDKRDGNHHSVVQKILRSIEDGVEEEELVGSSVDIRAAWKSEQREAMRKALESGNAPPAPMGRSSYSTDELGRRRGPGPPMRGAPPAGLKRR